MACLVLPENLAYISGAVPTNVSSMRSNLGGVIEITSSTCACFLEADLLLTVFLLPDISIFPHAVRPVGVADRVATRSYLSVDAES